MKTHAIDIRIYYEDTDAGGVVYHGSYLNFAERGRTEFLRNLGHQNSDLRKDFGVIFVVRNLEINYHVPGFLDDFLRLETGILSLKNSSFVMKHKFYRISNDQNGFDELVSDIRVALVCVDQNTLKPIRIPETLRQEFSGYIVE